MSTREFYRRACRFTNIDGLTNLRVVSTESPSARSAPPTLHHDVEFRVRYAETDQMGVVYHSNYLVWCEVGRTDFIRALGVTYAELERQGTSLAVAEATLRFHAPARYDDLVRVETTLSSVRSRAMTFDYVITDAATGRRLVTASTMLVSMDPTGRPVPLPAEVRSQLEAAVEA